MDEIIVGIADCRIGNVPGQVLATYALGSCIGLAVYDPTTMIGGLLHFMLPDSGIDSTRGRDNPYMFADTGIPLMLEAVCGRGASKRRLVVHAIGAAQMMDPQNVFEIGKRNYQAMRRVLWKAGILLQAEAVGGMKSRTVRLEIGTGRVWLQEGGEQRELAPGLPRKGAS
ncbi:putative chemoreceptor glutamine deamidase CheD [Candidatus Sulfopaludibacter sp. SbA3]|nr:putative chemoreceptor glutamine deamidase CheD [Candidatus Sulfopaludibacter sp. SbA3]